MHCIDAMIQEMRFGWLPVGSRAMLAWLMAVLLLGAVTPCAAQTSPERGLRIVGAKDVLQPWLRRCGANCAQLWEQTIGPAVAIKAQGSQ